VCVRGGGVMGRGGGEHCRRERSGCIPHDPMGLPDNKHSYLIPGQNVRRTFPFIACKCTSASVSAAAAVRRLQSSLVYTMALAVYSSLHNDISLINLVRAADMLQ